VHLMTECLVTGVNIDVNIDAAAESCFIYY